MKNRVSIKLVLGLFLLSMLFAACAEFDDEDYMDNDPGVKENVGLDAEEDAAGAGAESAVQGEFDGDIAE